MNSKQKIARVLKEIKDKSGISPNTKYVKFEFYPGIISCGGPSDDERKNILLKLQKEEIIKMNLSVEELLRNDISYITVEILKNFNKKYSLYKFYLNDISYWNFVNPLFWAWKIILLISEIIKIAYRHKIISAIIAIIGLLASDYSMAWKNLNYIINLIK